MTGRVRPGPALLDAPTSTGLTVYGCDQQEAALFRALAPRLGIVPTLVEAPVTEANAGLARGGACVSVSHRTPVSRSTLLALHRVGVQRISTRSVGCDHLDATYAAALGMTVSTVPYSPDSVADYTVLLALMLLRDTRRSLRRADAQDFRLDGTPGRELRDLTVGVVGTGRIGTAVIARLRGFGCRVLAHDRRPGPDARHVPLDELLRNSDLVTLHLPLTTATHHLLDRRRIDRLKPGAYVVNTARGALLDTAALLAALEGGRLAGAALDVLEGEDGTFYADRRGRPVDRTLSRLQALPNVLVSPHTAYYTEHSLHDLVEGTLRDFLEGRKQHG